MAMFMYNLSSNTHESSISTTSKCVWCVSDPRIEYNKRKQANYY